MIRLEDIDPAERELELTVGMPEQVAFRPETVHAQRRRPCRPTGAAPVGAHAVKLTYPESVDCPVCEGRGVIEYAHVYSDVDGTKTVVWELSSVIACGCRSAA